MKIDNLENIVKYTIVKWKPLNQSTKQVVKSYNGAKKLFNKIIKTHRATLVYAINDNGNHINLNHLNDFKKKETA
jgi:hypothetical protein